jgi:flavin reductase (DIM6/NTAB) family NADH-FMN oxidoreductase RutF
MVFDATTRVAGRRLRNVDPSAFRHAMRSLASGVSIIASGEGEERVGATVSSLASLSLTPPTLIVSLAKTSTTLAGLKRNGFFSANVLAARHEYLADRFSGRSGLQGANRFESHRWTRGASGAPILADALVSFDCLLEDVLDRHSHALVLGSVVATAEGPDEPALVHWRGAFGTTK